MTTINAVELLNHIKEMKDSLYAVMFVNPCNTIKIAGQIKAYNQIEAYILEDITQPTDHAAHETKQESGSDD